MIASTLAVDAYQLTTLVAHADAGRLAHDVRMAFFFRRLPKHRRYVVFTGLEHVLRHAESMRLSPDEERALSAHPMLGPALAHRPALARALAELDGFDGEIDAMPEGSLAFAGPAHRTDGLPFVLGDAQVTAYTPLFQIRTDMLRAKLVETPWLGYVNYMSMVASKAARVVGASGGKPVFEFGQRRTHPIAAADAAWAAYVAGVTGSSNMAAFGAFGVPAFGTMDHFAVQAAERPGEPRAVTERAVFEAMRAAFPGVRMTFLVDTYDTERGLAAAVEAAAGQPFSVRIDSNVSIASMKRAREVLTNLGATDAKIYVSDGLDEHRVAELAPYVDGFGVGENITCSPDAATGVGAVAKLVVNGYGKTTMKVAKGTGKATLPGVLQVHRFSDHDVIALADEPSPGGRALLRRVWQGKKRAEEPGTAEAARARAAADLAELEGVGGLTDAPPRKLVLSDALVQLVTRLYEEAAR
jgi:nicotinate phosphoribosyltransferase